MGIDRPKLQKTMGHASITLTAHVYAHLYDDELDDVAPARVGLDWLMMRSDGNEDVTLGPLSDLSV